jgi:hypothetical protein
MGIACVEIDYQTSDKSSKACGTYRTFSIDSIEPDAVSPDVVVPCREATANEN